MNILRETQDTINAIVSGCLDKLDTLDSAHQRRQKIIIEHELRKLRDELQKLGVNSQEVHKLEQSTRQLLTVPTDKG